MKPSSFFPKPTTLGEHIRENRRKRNMRQRSVAHELGVSVFTVLNWEKGKTEPPIQAMPRIFRWLGYEPFAAPKNLPECLLAKRRAMGWSIREAATRLGVDPGTWGAWERGNVVLSRKHRVVLARLLDLSPGDIDQDMGKRWSRTRT